MMRQKMLLFLMVFALANTNAQTDTSATLTFSGYGELYYLYDSAEPADHERPSFLYNHKRHNELNLNLAFAKAAYASQKTRANMALMVGNYAQYNLANEPTWAQFVFEANAGVKLSKTQTIWLDAGIMPSHIGFESAIGADCWTLTRSLVAENSPYFEAGAKLSFLNKKENLTVAALLLNGWQRIHRPESYDALGLGLQINYKPTEKLTLNYSNFIGSDKPNGEAVRRVYHNFYAIWDTQKLIGVIAGFDIGHEEGIGKWYSPVLILRLKLAEKLRFSNRYEAFKDPEEVVTYGRGAGGLDVLGVSFNLDYTVSENATLRLEARQLQSQNILFSNDAKGNFAAVAALCMRF